MINKPIRFYVSNPPENKKVFYQRFNIKYVTTENGVDWYDFQKKFDDKSIKFTFDDAGKVLSISKDATALFPEECYIFEVDVLPDGVDIYHNWYFDGDKFYQPDLTHKELMQQADETKLSLLQFASQKIAPLQDAVDLDMATQVEQDRLMAWKKYRVEVNRVDVSKATDILWPAQPE